jgi:DnaJ-domain-containing protein 1
MTDYFALLNQPRRPWLDEPALKAEFLRRSVTTHPDRVNGQSPDAKTAAVQFSEVNAAYQCLRAPRDRVRHLVELELGRKPGDLRNVPAPLADLFMRMAALIRESERLVAEKGRLTSPLLQAEFVGRIQPHLVAVETAQREVAAVQTQALAELQSLDAQWAQPGQRESCLSRLEELAQVLGFLGRWHAQLQEAHLRLTL